MSTKKGQDLLGLVQELSGLEDQEMKEIFCSKKLQKRNLSPDQLTTDDLRLIAVQMLESINSELSPDRSMMPQA